MRLIETGGFIDAATPVTSTLFLMLPGVIALPFNIHPGNFPQNQHLPAEIPAPGTEHDMHPGNNFFFKGKFVFQGIGQQPRNLLTIHHRWSPSVNHLFSRHSRNRILDRYNWICRLFTVIPMFVHISLLSCSKNSLIMKICD